MSEARAEIEGHLRRLQGTLDLGAALRLRGTVTEIGDGVARVAGLSDVGYEDLVRFDSGQLGLAFDLAPESTGVVLLSHATEVRAGEGAVGLGHAPVIVGGDGCLGRVIDPLGRPLDDRSPVPGPPQPVFREAPTLLDRAPVDRPLWTGVLAIDAAIPIGRGQRQLIVGDRNVGKTALALDIIAAQRAGDVACVYVVIGQPMSRVLGLREALDKSGCLANTAVVAADAASPPGLQYLAPYAGTAVADALRDAGRHVLVVYDDLTKHADTYRELALLLGRSPGREAYPGDIFYIHAELLERAAARNANAGGGSITAFPIVETTDSDIAAYIPTNIISITDGQIYLDAARFERNQRPAIDIGRSVSRIGGAAQPPIVHAAARNLKIQMSRFDALEALTRVGLDVDPATRRAVERGRIMRELLRQPRFSPRRLADELLALTAVSEGWLDELGPARAASVVWSAAQAGARTPRWDQIGGRERLDEELCAELRALVDAAREREP